MCVCDRAGLNEMYSASQRSLETERKLRQQLEQEVEMHRSIRQEKEASVEGVASWSGGGGLLVWRGWPHRGGGLLEGVASWRRK